MKEFFHLLFALVAILMPVKSLGQQVLNVSVDTKIDEVLNVSEEAGIMSMTVKGCPIIYDPDDYTVVQKTAQMLSDDLERLTGSPSKVTASSLLPECDAIVVGTLGKSHIIDHLALRGDICVDSLKGKWERFVIKTVFLPGDGKSKRGGIDRRLLVIVGSDRRATAYGMTTVSRALGIDPWVWWSDVPVKRSPAATISADYLSIPPTVIGKT